MYVCNIIIVEGLDFILSTVYWIPVGFFYALIFTIAQLVNYKVVSKLFLKMATMTTKKTSKQLQYLF